MSDLLDLGGDALMRASASTGAGSSTGTASAQSIRSYRSKKIRPCDNCRSRRQRCDIPSPGAPCRLCVSTKKTCTFLRERRKAPSDLKKHQHRTSEGSIAPLTGRARTVSVTTPASPDDGAGGMASLSALTAYILSTRARSIDASGAEPLALDDEAANDEELYLVGTASERDALILNSMTDPVNGPRPATESLIPGIRLRAVGPGTNFVFYKSLPYGGEPEGDGTWQTLVQLVGENVVPGVMQTFFEIEGQGHPIWRRQTIEDATASTALQCFCLTAGLIYVPQYRHLHRKAYVLTLNKLRASPRARLWTMQIYLCDLDGREAINPSGNFIVLGMAISMAKLLGLHEDCGAWSIPAWERELRTRLWWSLLLYDRFITTPNAVPLPGRTPVDPPSYDAFVSACELAVILEDLGDSSGQCGCAGCGQPNRLAQLSLMSNRLDSWRDAIQSRGLFNHEPAPPGVKSLHLLYLGSCVMVVKGIFEALGNDELDAKEAARQSCLMACEAMVDFVAALTLSDLFGYWSSHSPFMLSLCLTLLVRIIVNSQEEAVRESALLALRRFVSTVAEHQKAAEWDVANLALARANYFIPLLSRRNAEFGTVLEPLQISIPEFDDSMLDNFLQNLVDPAGMQEFLGSWFNAPVLQQ